MFLIQRYNPQCKEGEKHTRKLTKDDKDKHIYKEGKQNQTRKIEMNLMGEYYSAINDKMNKLTSKSLYILRL